MHGAPIAQTPLLARTAQHPQLALSCCTAGAWPPEPPLQALTLAELTAQAVVGDQDTSVLVSADQVTCEVNRAELIKRGAPGTALEK